MTEHPIAQNNKLKINSIYLSTLIHLLIFVVFRSSLKAFTTTFFTARLASSAALLSPHWLCRGTGNHWLLLLSIKASEWGSGASMHQFPHGKQLSMGALNREEGLGAPVGDMRKGGSGPPCAIPLHRAGEYRHFVIFYLPL